LQIWTEYFGDERGRGLDHPAPPLSTIRFPDDHPSRQKQGKVVAKVEDRKYWGRTREPLFDEIKSRVANGEGSVWEVIDALDVERDAATDDKGSQVSIVSFATPFKDKFIRLRAAKLKAAKDSKHSNVYANW